MDSEPINLMDYKDLVYHLCYKFGVRNLVEDSEEYAEVWVALAKAAKVFDSSKGIKFVTYAYILGKRAIISYRAFRLTAKRGGRGESGKETPIATLPLGEFPYASKERPVGEDLENKEFCQHLLSKFPPAIRAIMEDVYLRGLSRRQIGQELKKSPTHVGEWMKFELEKLRESITKEGAYHESESAI